MFTCGVCLKIFTRKDNLSRHLKSVAHRKTIIEYAPKTSTVYPEPSTTTAPTVQEIHDYLNDSTEDAAFMEINMDFDKPGKILFQIDKKKKKKMREIVISLFFFRAI
jgi:hypothetical protein